jgi:hypothetical protein
VRRLSWICNSSVQQLSWQDVARADGVNLPSVLHKQSNPDWTVRDSVNDQCARSISRESILDRSAIDADLKFNGGTLRSKAYGVIRHFSEDVGLTLDMGALARDRIAKCSLIEQTSISQSAQ